MNHQYEIRQEPFTGTAPLPPYTSPYGGRHNIQGAHFTHAIYHRDGRLIFRATNRKHANQLLDRLHTYADIRNNIAA